MICKKVAARLYFLRQLKRAKVPTNDLLSFYTTCIRPVAEYACPVFHGRRQNVARTSVTHLAIALCAPFFLIYLEHTQGNFSSLGYDVDIACVHAE